jgi:ATP-dependent Clp protease adaptor protein ClpS
MRRRMRRRDANRSIQPRVCNIMAKVPLGYRVAEIPRGLAVSEESVAGVAEPVEQVVLKKRAKTRKKPKHQPRYNVILWDDQDHSFEYVIGMMQKLFGYPVEKGFQIANEVHHRGRAIVLTTTREHAELKRDQIHAYGKDPLEARCKGSMSATIEPVPD